MVTPSSFAAVPVMVEAAAMSREPVVSEPVNVTVSVPEMATSAAPKAPDRATPPVESNAAVMVLAVMPVRTAAGVVCNAVIVTVPAPLAVLPVSWAAVPCSVAPDATENVAVPIVALSTFIVLVLMVVTAFPRLPVNVTLPPTAAVTEVEVIALRSAAAVEFSAVTATVPAPSIVTPVTFAAVAARV